MRRLKKLYGLILILLLCRPSLAGAEVWVFFRPDIPLHVDTVGSLKSISEHKLVFCPVGKTSFSFLESHPPKFAVVLGDAALQLALQMVWKVKILTTLVDNMPGDPRAVFLDTGQPHMLQLQLLKQLMPDIDTIWYPYASNRFAPDKEIMTAAETATIRIDSHLLSDPRALPASLRALGRPNTAALLSPDPGIMNDAVIQAIFLASFRSHAPVISFSESLVKQGAAFAYVLSPRNLAASIKEIIDEVLHNADFPRTIRLFDRWELILNATVLDKLKLQIPDQVKKSANRVY